MFPNFFFMTYSKYKSLDSRLQNTIEISDLKKEVHAVHLTSSFAQRVDIQNSIKQHEYIILKSESEDLRKKKRRYTLDFNKCYVYIVLLI